MSVTFTDEQRDFLERQRVAHLATADGQVRPHVMPVCFGLIGETLYITIDAKPKSGPARALKRLRNIAENPNVALVADHYDNRDWSKLGWVMVRGRADILESGGEHERAQQMLKARYAQYADMDLAPLPVIAIRVETVASWGDLDET